MLSGTYAPLITQKPPSTRNTPSSHQFHSFAAAYAASRSIHSPSASPASSKDLEDSDFIRRQLEILQKQLEEEQLAAQAFTTQDHFKSIQEELELLSKDIEEELLSTASLSGTSTPIALTTPPRDDAAVVLPATALSGSFTMSSSSLSISPQKERTMPAPHRLLSITPSTSGAVTPLTPNSPLTTTFSSPSTTPLHYDTSNTRALSVDYEDIPASNMGNAHHANQDNNNTVPLQFQSSIPSLALAPSTLEAALKLSFLDDDDTTVMPLDVAIDNDEEWLLKTDPLTSTQTSSEFTVRPLPKVPKLALPTIKHTTATTKNLITSSRPKTSRKISPFVSEDTVPTGRAAHDAPSNSSVTMSTTGNAAAKDGAATPLSSRHGMSKATSGSPLSRPPGRGTAAVQGIASPPLLGRALSFPTTLDAPTPRLYSNAVSSGDGLSHRTSKIPKPV